MAICGIEAVYGYVDVASRYNATRHAALKSIEESTDEAFRDDEGNPINHPGLRLRLSDFACEEIVQDELGSEDLEICISGIQLCEYLAAAEGKTRQSQSLRKQSFSREARKRKRLETPPEEIRSDDEARYVEQEERAAKRAADHDNDYTATSPVNKFLG
ncbi:hypothetical protein GQ44DRAFT_727483 [Phaeosphaeriaceae sp. PMI808]|nr:hypothetical protein GQ44DRAFT_727483 [Phaeosphaeriaceae sp. PMI808]